MPTSENFFNWYFSVIGGQSERPGIHGLVFVRQLWVGRGLYAKVRSSLRQLQRSRPTTNTEAIGTVLQRSHSQQHNGRTRHFNSISFYFYFYLPLDFCPLLLHFCSDFAVSFRESLVIILAVLLPDLLDRNKIHSTWCFDAVYCFVVASCVVLQPELGEDMGTP